MYKIVFYVPLSHAKGVKQAVFAAGAGKIGNYDQCCWQCEGRGQFRPLDGSNAFVGEPGRLEHVDELRIELVCSDDCLRAAVQALRDAHPYEAPAIDVWQLAELP